ncbi:MAG: DNA (cytosine-5-)-methyltransferase [Deltaproteobacteria bacterium]|nr:DNA (cytosine-5-)-methyltransferase [Deltaproteobacteria bacterium]
MRKYKVISLFSGAMGLDIGLEQSGRFEIVACVESEKSYCDTIRFNQAAGRLSKKLVLFEKDIRDVSSKEILRAAGLKAKDVDLIVGGPPCQSFSTAGRRGTIQDHRGTLLWEFLRLIEEIKPRMFLMENVRGLLSAAVRHRPILNRPDKGGVLLQDDEKPGSVVKLFARDLANLKRCSYHLDIFEVNAVNYGAPQIRERVLFIGNRYGATVDFPTPSHGMNPIDSTNQQLGLFHDKTKQPWRTLGDAIKDLKEEHPLLMDFSPRKKEFLRMVPPGSNWRSLSVEAQKESMGKAWYAKGGRSGWWRRLTFELPCPTLVTMPNHASTSLCHPTETRALSVSEYSRIQEFPDDWAFCGKVSEQYAQIGNAVPTRLGKVAGQVVSDLLDSLYKRKWKPYPLKDRTPRIIYLQSHIRTRNWYKNGEAIVWDDKEKVNNARYSRSKTIKRVRNLK